jgi:hypothetical protein
MTETTTRKSARSALRAGACVAVLASGALLMTACSSSGSSSAAAKPAGSVSASVSASASASASGKGSASGAQDMTAYRDCLSQHGLKLPSFSGRPSGRPSGSGRPGGFGGGFGGASADPATQKALQACESLRPQFNGRRGGGDNSAYQAFTSCLKDHGVTLPTPSPGASNSPARRGGFGTIDTSDPKTAKAYTTCKPLLPTRPAPSPSAT